MRENTAFENDSGTKLIFNGIQPEARGGVQASKGLEFFRFPVMEKREP